MKSTWVVILIAIFSISCDNSQSIKPKEYVLFEGNNYAVPIYLLQSDVSSSFESHVSGLVLETSPDVSTPTSYFDIKIGDPILLESDPVTVSVSFFAPSSNPSINVNITSMYMRGEDSGGVNEYFDLDGLTITRDNQVTVTYDLSSINASLSGNKVIFGLEVVKPFGAPGEATELIIEKIVYTY